MSGNILLRCSLFIVLMTIITGIIVNPVFAEVPTAGNNTTSTNESVQTTGLTDPKELGAFMDGVITDQLEAYNIPGATVAVVKDGKLFFAKGYGYADLEKRKPVVANQTLFRAGSISKLFTWTAVMQLAEQGKLDLNADVNTYLKDFKIPATYTQPITLTNLMTHTPGFEETWDGLAASAEDLEPLGKYHAHNIPARVRPPGEFTSYSNWGVSLAGYIVQEASGVPFEQYVEENIFKPLDMRNSTFRQPLPPDMTANMAVGYTYADGVYNAGQFEYFKIFPAGSISATATDMAKFMIMHLQDGRYGNARVLQNATAQRMHSHLFSNDPNVSGFAYGFVELNLNNQRMISHAGDTILFHSILVLLPEHNVGLFVSYNSAGGVNAREELVQAFLDRYYPAPAPAVPKPPADFNQRAGKFTGEYLPTQRAFTTFIKWAYNSNKFSITANPDGTLQVQGPGGPTRWVEVEPLVFLLGGGKLYPDFSDRLVFREDSQGRITYFFFNNAPTYAMEKLVWYETSGFNYNLLVVCIVLFLSVMVWPIGYIISRRTGKSGHRPFLPRLARWLAGGVCALNISFMIWLLTGNLVSVTIFGIPPIVTVFLAIALLASVLTIGLVIFTVLAWKNKYWNLAGRLHYTLITFAALAFVWFLNQWNLLGFHY